jgi:hypothetical protein
LIFLTERLDLGYCYGTVKLVIFEFLLAEEWDRYHFGTPKENRFPWGRNVLALRVSACGKNTCRYSLAPLVGYSASIMTSLSKPIGTK